MTAKIGINLVWLKRDLRVHDHAPLAQAVATPLPTGIIYFFEPSVLQSPEADVRHWRFVYESLLDLQVQLKKYQIPLWMVHAEVVPTLQKLHKKYQICNIFSHQETGVKITFDRDKAVKDFCNKNGIHWQEFNQDGVRRGAKNRDGWQEGLEQYFATPLIQPDLSKLPPLHLPDTFWQQLRGPDLPVEFTIYQENFQRGGPTYAQRYLQHFFSERVVHYSRHLSKPLLSRKSCSRLSPYLAWGNLSARQIFQASEAHKAAFRTQINNFQSRLWWRSHYLQKLESHWRLEFEPINPGFQLLQRTLDERFEAWARGRTGYPMIDASMRCLQATGWLNFRMRAMLATFVTFTLWQDWRAAALHLARLFLDFEPGIHYAQFQMQAGLTGYHTLRIFNPTVQSQRHDNQGFFVKKWLPELQHVPTPQVFTPWTMTNLEQAFYGCRIGVDYPAPIVDYDAATRANKDRYWQVRQLPEGQAALPAIWERLCLPQDIAKYQQTGYAIARELENRLEGEGSDNPH